MVCSLACFWVIIRSVKNRCRIGARLAITDPRASWRGAACGRWPFSRRPEPAVLDPPRCTSYSDIGITGITPIPGLFRYPFPCTRDGPVAWDDALSRLSPAGIIRCVSCAHEVSFLAFSAHVIVPPCSSERRAGSPNERGRCHGGRGCPGWLMPCSAWFKASACPATRSLATASAARRSWSSAADGASTRCQAAGACAARRDRPEQAKRPGEDGPHDAGVPENRPGDLADDEPGHWPQRELW